MRLIVLPLVALLLTGCNPLRNEDIRREIASMEKVSRDQIELVDVVITDGWDDGADATIRYKLCRDRNPDRCAEKQIDASFGLRWEMFSHRKMKADLGSSPG